jgi:hypothetical protein
MLVSLKAAEKAIAAVRICADTLEKRAVGLARALPPLPMDERLRASAMELCSALSDTSGRVLAELASLQQELTDGKADAATVASRLSDLDATMTRQVAAAAELADKLESAAKHDAANAPAFELVIEAVGVLLQDLVRAEAETHKLRTGMSEDSELTAVRW